MQWRPRAAMWKQITDIVVSYGGSVADIGCGVGLAYPYLRGGVDYTGIDFTPTFIEQAREMNPSGKFIYGDAKNLEGIQDKQFTIVLLTHVIEHVHPDDVGKVLNEAIRVAEKAVVINWFKPPRDTYTNKIEERDYIVVYYNKHFIQSIFDGNKRFNGLKVHRGAGTTITYEVYLRD